MFLNSHIKRKFSARVLLRGGYSSLPHSLLRDAALLALVARCCPLTACLPSQCNTLGLHRVFPQTVCSLALFCFAAKQWPKLLTWLSVPTGRQNTCFMHQEIERWHNACLSPGLNSSSFLWKLFAFMRINGECRLSCFLFLWQWSHCKGGRFVISFCLKETVINFRSISVCSGAKLMAAEELKWEPELLLPRGHKTSHWSI